MIQIHVECNGIPSEANPQPLVWQGGFINEHHIEIFYTSVDDRGSMIVMNTNVTYRVSETPEEINELIQEAKKEPLF